MALVSRIVIWVLICSSCYCGSSGVNNPTNPSNSFTAKSASLNDVNEAISNAQPGDSVTVPPGTATWSNQLVITKGIKLIGAGVGITNITSNYSGTLYQENNFLIHYSVSNPSANEPFRISGFTIDLANKCEGILITNNSLTPTRNNRIDHITIGNSVGRVIKIDGTIYGVCDNCNLNVGLGLLTHYARGADGSTWSSQTGVYNFGTGNAWYWEDNEIWANETVADGGYASAYVFRHNHFWGATRNPTPFMDMHGNGGAGRSWSGLGVEIYENDMDWRIYGGDIIDLRGGKGLIYNNRVLGSSVDVKIREEYIDSDNPPAYNPFSNQPQHVSDTYIWGNTRNGSPANVGAVSETKTYPNDASLRPEDRGRTIPQADVDFFSQKSPFGGTSGMGVGLLADRPTSGSAGVGYWATDVKKLYRWTTGTGWEEYYTPYPYPHPLRGSL